MFSTIVTITVLTLHNHLDHVSDPVPGLVCVASAHVCPSKVPPHLGDQDQDKDQELDNNIVRNNHLHCTTTSTMSLTLCLAWSV